MIDDVETGRQLAPKFRVAFEVDGSVRATTTLVDAGAEFVVSLRRPRRHGDR
jgi:hypothetical protein